MTFEQKLKTIILHVGAEYENCVGQRPEPLASRTSPELDLIALDVKIGELYRTLEQLTELKKLYYDKRYSDGHGVRTGPPNPRI